MTRYRGTPLQLVTRPLEKAKMKGLGADHEALKREGQAAVTNCMDRLEDIVILLRRLSLTVFIPDLTYF